MDSITLKGDRGSFVLNGVSGIKIEPHQITFLVPNPYYFINWLDETLYTNIYGNFYKVTFTSYETTSSSTMIKLKVLENFDG